MLEHLHSKLKLSFLPTRMALSEEGDAWFADLGLLGGRVAAAFRASKFPKKDGNWSSMICRNTNQGGFTKNLPLVGDMHYYDTMYQWQTFVKEGYKNERITGLKAPTSRRFNPMIMATTETAMGMPWPIWPYAFPANDAPTPSTASVVASPNENATESTNNCTYTDKNLWVSNSKTLRVLKNSSSHLKRRGYEPACGFCLLRKPLHAKGDVRCWPQAACTIWGPCR